MLLLPFLIVSNNLDNSFDNALIPTRQKGLNINFGMLDQNLGYLLVFIPLKTGIFTNNGGFDEEVMTSIFLVMVKCKSPSTLLECLFYAFRNIARVYLNRKKKRIRSIRYPDDKGSRAYHG